MRVHVALLVVICFFSTGCLSTARIKRDPSVLSAKDIEKTDVKGIPFYVKTARCKQETTWLQPFYTLTFKKTTKTVFIDEDAANKEAESTKTPKPKLPEPIVSTSNQVLSLSEYSAWEVLQLRAYLGKSGSVTPDEGKQIEDSWNAIAVWTPYVPLAQEEDALIGSADAVEVANLSTPEVSVDYSRVYYYNGPRPWIGSSQLDVKLAADGTLSEGSNQIESETLSNFVPISAVLSAAALTAGSAATTALPGQPPPPPAPYATQEKVQYQLTIKEDAYRRTHSKYVGFSTPCALDPTGVTTQYSLTISLSPEKEEKKDNGNTVKVNGSVVLPKKADEKK